MKEEQVLKFLHILEKLKCNTRHSWTSNGRQESVAEHSFRLALLWLLVEEEFPDIDHEKILRMCLIHDFGEAICGDIPSFQKTGEDERQEEHAVDAMLSQLSEVKQKEFSALFAEMRALKTREAKIWRALDMMEAAVQHNEAALSTWLPLERELNPVYGEQEAACEPYLSHLRALVRHESEEKLSEESNHVDSLK